MSNHPNLSQRTDAPGRNPTPDEIRAARHAAGLTQTQAASLVYTTLSGWQRWEQAERRMHPAVWTLWRARVALAAGDWRLALRLLRP
jgi:putative transcriptional regulator